MRYLDPQNLRCFKVFIARKGVACHIVKRVTARSAKQAREKALRKLVYHDDRIVSVRPI